MKRKCIADECISLTCEHVLTTSDCRSCNCKNACKEGCAGSVPPDLDYYSPERLFFELCCDHCEYNDEICKNVLGIPVYSVCNLKPSEDNQIYELNQVPDTCPCMTGGVDVVESHAFGCEGAEAEHKGKEVE